MSPTEYVAGPMPGWARSRDEGSLARPAGRNRPHHRWRRDRLLDASCAPLCRGRRSRSSAARCPGENLEARWFGDDDEGPGMLHSGLACTGGAHLLVDDGVEGKVPVQHDAGAPDGQSAAAIAGARPSCRRLRGRRGVRRPPLPRKGRTSSRRRQAPCRGARTTRASAREDPPSRRGSAGRGPLRSRWHAMPRCSRNDARIRAHAASAPGGFSLGSTISCLSS